jgi:hypothetical protein
MDICLAIVVQKKSLAIGRGGKNRIILRQDGKSVLYKNNIFYGLQIAKNI